MFAFLDQELGPHLMMPQFILWTPNQCMMRSGRCRLLTMMMPNTFSSNYIDGRGEDEEKRWIEKRSNYCYLLTSAFNKRRGKKSALNIRAFVQLIVALVRAAHRRLGVPFLTFHAPPDNGF
jgi:hypothetical protein